MIQGISSFGEAVGRVGRNRASISFMQFVDDVSHVSFQINSVFSHIFIAHYFFLLLYLFWITGLNACLNHFESRYLSP